MGSKAWEEANRERLLARKRELHRINAEREREYNRAYRSAHREQVNANARAYRAANKDKVRTWNRGDRARHRDKRLAYNRQYQQQTAEQRADYWRAYRARNRRRFRARDNARWHLYRARKRAAGGTFTPAEWEALKAHYNYQCLCCALREPDIKLTADHIVPVSKGGRNDINNIQPLCITCNLRKGTACTDYR
jgi:5-methylcytosine-specific restriction endonuclease McrA